MRVARSRRTPPGGRRRGRPAWARPTRASPREPRQRGGRLRAARRDAQRRRSAERGSRRRRRRPARPPSQPGVRHVLEQHHLLSGVEHGRNADAMDEPEQRPLLAQNLFVRCDPRDDIADQQVDRPQPATQPPPGPAAQLRPRREPPAHHLVIDPARRRRGHPCQLLRHQRAAHSAPIDRLLARTEGWWCSTARVPHREDVHHVPFEIDSIVEVVPNADEVIRRTPASSWLRARVPTSGCRRSSWNARRNSSANLAIRNHHEIGQQYPRRPEEHIRILRYGHCHRNPR
jgi:hypothetical protein